MTLSFAVSICDSPPAVVRSVNRRAAAPHFPPELSPAMAAPALERV